MHMMETTKALRDGIVQKDSMWQQSQGPTDKHILFPFSFTHVENMQHGSVMQVCSI